MSSEARTCLTPYGAVVPKYRERYSVRERHMRPIVVESDSILMDPRLMIRGQFYAVTLDDQPYLYRKTNKNEIEVYGLGSKA